MTNGRHIFYSVLAALILLVSSGNLTAQAIQMEARLLAQGSAILLIDGKQYRLQAGDKSEEGVLLVSSDGRTAIVEYQGERQRLTLNRPIASTYNPVERREVRIQPGAGGHYIATGSINGHPVEFMVDTGATSVALNQHVAKRLGINYLAGKETRVSTASGMAPAYIVMLDRIAVGALEIRNVEAFVTMGNFPQVILLGNSYLGLLNWRVDNGVLLLQTKY